MVDWGRGIGWIWTGAAASGGGGEGSKWGEPVRSPPASAAVPLFDRRSPAAAAAAAAGGGLEVRKKTKKREREREEGRKRKEGRACVYVSFLPLSSVRPSVSFLSLQAAGEGEEERECV